MLSMKSLETIAEAFGGIVVTGTLPGSTSERAGVRYGDILLRYNGIPTPDLGAYVRARSVPADGLVVTILRDGRELELSLARSTDGATPERVAEAAAHLAQSRLFGDPG